MLEKIIDAYLGRTRPADETVWHKWETGWFVRLTDGKLSLSEGQLWRRRVGDRWEYQQDAETVEQWEKTQW